jgi:hypothetical protein
MNKLIDKILTEWAYRVHDGMPNVKNPMHILQLKESMEAMELPKDFIFEFIQNLFEDKKEVPDEVKKKAKQMGLIWKRVGYGKKGQKGITHKIDYEKGKLVPVDGEEKPEKSTDDGGEEKPPPKPKVTNIDTHQFKGDGNTDAKSRNDVKNLSPKQQRKIDHDTTDEQLLLSKKEAKAQAEKKGEKGVGMGTAESRAGEAAVHHILRRLIKGEDINDIKKELMVHAKDKTKILDKKWTNAAVNTALWIHDAYPDNIKEIVWDTPAGRSLIGVEGHGTSSDMFIKTQDGRNVGISLKQTTAVFLLSGGYDKQHKMLTEELEKDIPPEELEEFKKNTSIDTYWHGDDGANNDGYYKHMTNIYENYKNDEEFRDFLFDRTVEYQKMSEEEFNTIMGKNAYKKYHHMVAGGHGFEFILKKLPNISEPERKIISKMMKDPAIRGRFPEHYDNLRNQEVALTKAILDAASGNPNITKSLKKTCLKGLHAEDILFSSADGLDEFKTVYGNKPAVELSKGVLLQIFDVQGKYDEWQKITDEEDPDGHMREELKEQIMDELAEKLVIDMKDGAKSGEVKIKHTDTGQTFHLFGLKARAKGIGSSPALEMFQTSFMGNVIKEGNVDIREWNPKTLESFINKREKELLEEIEDSSTEQRKALQVELDELRALREE